MMIFMKNPFHHYSVGTLVEELVKKLVKRLVDEKYC
jgi:hypothetical protein